MSFWASSASPNVWHTIGYWKPDYIRKQPGLQPLTPSGGLSRYHQLYKSDINSVCDLWRNHYGDKDWFLDANPSWVQTYLDDHDIIVLGVFTIADNALIGTIVSTPFSGGSTRMANAEYKNVRVIEGLCIHTNFRNKGLAGYLISAMDYETSKIGPTIHLWSRELTVAPLPFFSTVLNTQIYAYIKCAEARATMECTRVPWQTMVRAWESFASRNDKHMNNSKNSQIIATIPVNRRNGLEAWSVHNSIVVLSDTKRCTKADSNPIWEVIWTGKTVDKQDLQSCPVDLAVIESLASMKKGILFALQSHVKGAFVKPWYFGQSGVHSWYIYNFIGVRFGHCQIEALREEI